MTTQTHPHTRAHKPHRLLLAAGLALLALAAHADCGPGGYAHLPQGPFVDAGNGYVRHVPTHTVWKRCAEGQLWNGKSCTGQALELDARGAQARMNAVNASAPGTQNAGQTSWRLPRLHELRLLVASGCARPAINQTQFPRTPARAFWTETPYVDAPDSAWTVNFMLGTPQPAERRTRAAVRLMRAATPDETMATLTSHAVQPGSFLPDAAPGSATIVTRGPPPAAAATLPVALLLPPPPTRWCIP
ncbi:MAG: DUF1566 domain-containing protein [Pseudomonadota bacterium]|nr:DUF1566 domain-containing protein [Pseudomonadota bacterium]